MNPSTDALILGLMLYGLLPLWLGAAFVDWVCHRRSRIETTSSLPESLLHIGMGLSVAAPLWLALTCEVNVGILLLSILVIAVHEVLAHKDVAYASGKREITVWEAHAHSFLETVPIFLAALMACRNYDVLIDLVHLRWAGNLLPQLRHEPVGAELGDLRFARNFFYTMLLVGIFPYAEEFMRCLRARRRAP